MSSSNIAKPLPCAEFLNSILDYMEDTGKLYWKVREGASSRWNSRYAGKEAFTAPTFAGYKHGNINDEKYLAHRIIWKMIKKVDPIFVDHINGDRSDNRLVNLRSVTKSVNCSNIRPGSSNTSGVVGVSFCKRNGLFRAYIKKKHIGYYSTIEEAIDGRKNSETLMGYNSMNRIEEFLEGNGLHVHGTTVEDVKAQIDDKEDEDD